MKASPLYIETRIQTDLPTLWAYTQTPEQHEKWDLRFSTIRYLPKKPEETYQFFEYTTRIGFGLAVSGMGKSKGNSTTGETRTSVLAFWSDSRLSLIRKGAGFWKYQPTAQGLRFFTKYDYEPRWGLAGTLFDRFVFRPLMGWATALSFDVLKRWIEKKHPPALLYSLTFIYWMVQITLAVIWMYQGVFPKILFPDSGELAILQGAGIEGNTARYLLTAVGIGEIVFGSLFLSLNPKRWLHLLNIGALLFLGLGALGSNLGVFVQPFNPATLNLAMISLSLIALSMYSVLPSAKNCLRKPRTT